MAGGVSTTPEPVLSDESMSTYETNAVEPDESSEQSTYLIQAAKRAGVSVESTGVDE